MFITFITFILLFSFYYLNIQTKFKIKITFQKCLIVISSLAYPSYSVLLSQSSTSISLKPEIKYFNLY